MMIMQTRCEWRRFHKLSKPIHWKTVELSRVGDFLKCQHADVSQMLTVACDKHCGVEFFFGKLLKDGRKGKE